MTLSPVEAGGLASPHREVGRDLRETVERAPVGIAHFDATGKFLFVNPTLGSIFGLSRDELLQMTFQEISFPGDLAACLHLTAQLAAGAIPRYTHEKRFVRPDGTHVYSRVIVTAIRDAAGAVEFFLGVVEDISDQWAAEQARRAAEERLQLALEASGTGIYRFDMRTEALDYSNGMARVFGLPEGERLHSMARLIGVIHPEDLPGVLEAYHRCVKEGADLDEEFRVVLPDGSERWLCDRARTTRDEDGVPRYLTGACIDVTARRFAEAEREKMLAAEQSARADAEHAAKLRDEVLAVVAHDLRNPVHTIMLSAGAVAELPLAKEDADRQVALIRRAAGGMDRLIRDLLDVTQIETGRLAIHVAPTSLADLIHECASAASAQLAQAGLTIGLKIDPDVGEIVCDRARIGQVLGNLLGNAVKFTPPGGRVSISARRTGDVVVEVSDTGIGVSPSDLQRLFDRYWQADRASRNGVGLGLTIVRGIVEAHGGRIEVSSGVGVGTTFRISLPAPDK